MTQSRKPAGDTDDAPFGPSTRAVHAGLPAGEQGEHSAGIEDPADLVADLERALKA